MDKIEVRRQFRKKPISEYISQAVVTKLEALDEYRSAPLVLAYIPLPDEIDITPLLEKKEKHFAFPVTENGNRMHFAMEAGFTMGLYGIREPMGPSLESFEKGTVIIMPAVAYDKAMRRIGRGGGYYDRFIAEHPELIKIGLIPSKRVLSEVITEDYDAKADIILTEDSVLRIEAL